MILLAHQLRQLDDVHRGLRCGELERRSVRHAGRQQGLRCTPGALEKTLCLTRTGCLRSLLLRSAWSSRSGCGCWDCSDTRTPVPTPENKTNSPAATVRSEKQPEASRPSEFGSPWRSPSPRAGKATAERRTVRQDVWFNPTRTAPRLSDLGPVLYLPPLPTNSACFAPRIRKYFSLTHIRHSFSPQHGSRPSSALGLDQFVRPLGNIGLC